MRIEIPLSEVRLKARDQELYQDLTEKFLKIQNPREKLCMLETMCQWFGEGRRFGSARIRGVIVGKLMEK